MFNRTKILAAALGLVVATGVVADASARTVVTTHAAHRTALHRVVAVKSTRIVRVTKHVRIVRRAPAHVTIITRAAPVLAVRPLHRGFVGPRIVERVRFAPARAKFVKRVTVTKKVVRFHKAPLVRHAMAHRLAAKTVIR